MCDGDGSFCATHRVAAAALGAIVKAVGTPEAASAFFATKIDGLAADAVTAVKPPTTKDDGSVVVGFTLKPDANNFKDGDCTDEFKVKMKAAVRAIMTGVGTDAVLVVTCDAAARRRRRMMEYSCVEGKICKTGYSIEPGADLSYANLANADLTGASLRHCV